MSKKGGCEGSDDNSGNVYDLVVMRKLMTMMMTAIIMLDITGDDVVGECGRWWCG